VKCVLPTQADRGLEGGRGDHRDSWRRAAVGGVLPCPGSRVIIGKNKRGVRWKGNSRHINRDHDGAGVRQCYEMKKKSNKENKKNERKNRKLPAFLFLELTTASRTKVSPEKVSDVTLKVAGLTTTVPAGVAASVEVTMVTTSDTKSGALSESTCVTRPTDELPRGNLQGTRL